MHPPSMNQLYRFQNGSPSCTHTEKACSLVDVKAQVVPGDHGELHGEDALKEESNPEVSDGALPGRICIWASPLYGLLGLEGNIQPTVMADQRMLEAPQARKTPTVNGRDPFKPGHLAAGW